MEHCKTASEGSYDRRHTNEEGMSCAKRTSGKGRPQIPGHSRWSIIDSRVPTGRRHLPSLRQEASERRSKHSACMRDPNRQADDYCCQHCLSYGILVLTLGILSVTASQFDSRGY